MDEAEARRRFAASPVATLASVRPDGRPHVVPVTFALSSEVVHTAVDAKPKRHQQLQRIANLRHQPRCALLVHHYEPDWDRLWWVRADGLAAIVDQPRPDHPGLPLLAERYVQYRRQAPPGPLIEVTVTRWVGWSAAG